MQITWLVRPVKVKKGKRENKEKGPSITADTETGRIEPPQPKGDAEQKSTHYDLCRGSRSLNQ